MKKILKVIDNPPLKSHQLFALPLSIILTKEKYYHFVYNEFTQIYTYTINQNELAINFYNYEFMEAHEPLDCLKIVPHMLKLKHEIVDFFKILINNDYYIYDYCDDYYIKKIGIDYHRYHDLLLYGYDDAQNEFYAKAYIKGDLCNFKIPYQEIIDAHDSSYIDDGITHSIFLYKLRDINPHLNIEKLKWHLLDYIEGVDTVLRESPRTQREINSVWGVNIYDRIIKAYQENMTLTTNNIYCFYEHKVFMFNKLEFFSKHTDLVCSDEVRSGLEMVCNRAETVFKIMMKINMKISEKMDVKSDNNFLCDKLQELKQLELVILKQFYQENSNIFNEI